MSRIDAALVAFLVTLIFMFALRPMAHAAGLVDRPGGRKAHIGIVPVIGGISMYLGLLVALPLAEPVSAGMTSFLAATGLLVAVGAIDDRFDIPPMVRLIAHGTAGLILCLGAGLVADNLGNLLFFGDIRLGLFAVPFTVLVTISVINAFNMLDGMDGLAGSISFSSLLLVAFASALFGGGAGLTLASVSLAVVVAFLVFNFPTPFNRPVRTFMGDAGSTMLGFIVVWMGLRLAHGPEQVISPVTALWIAALPIFDLFISFARRIRKGQSPFRADREHFHHILLRATGADAAAGLLDVSRLAAMLSRIRGRIVHKRLTRISPLAVPVMLEIGRESVKGEADEMLLSEVEDDLIREAMAEE